MTTRRELIAGAALAPMALALNQSVAAEHHPKGDKNEDAPQYVAA